MRRDNEVEVLPRKGNANPIYRGKSIDQRMPLKPELRLLSFRQQGANKLVWNQTAIYSLVAGTGNDHVLVFLRFNLSGAASKECFDFSTGGKNGR